MINIGEVYRVILPAAEGARNPQSGVADFTGTGRPTPRSICAEQHRAGSTTTLVNCRRLCKFYDQALPILRELGDRREEANTLNNIGLVYANTGENEKASPVLQPRVAACTRSRRSSPRSNCAFQYRHRLRKHGPGAEGARILQSGAALAREVGYRRGEATTLNAIGVAYEKIGQPQKALEFYDQALPILREIGYHRGEAQTLTNIGLIYDRIGQPQGGTNSLQ